MNFIEQQLFDALERKLWGAADRLRSALDAAVYQQTRLGTVAPRQEVFE